MENILRDFYVGAIENRLGRRHLNVLLLNIIFIHLVVIFVPNWIQFTGPTVTPVSKNISNSVYPLNSLALGQCCW